jgi:cellulose synthase/poly-beta-1,6-N-acetylglucosamine synthase-like glycosyltransferase
MTWTIANSLLLALAAITALPMLLLALECLAALLPRRAATAPGNGCPRPRVAVLIPAHNEQGVIEATLPGILRQLAAGDRLVVVADNCDDETAAVAREAGAVVVERRDPARRGKGYALQCGLEFLRGDPPDAVIMVDADCLVGQQAVGVLARLAHQSGRPVQGLNLTDRVPARGAAEMAALLGNRVTNLVRPLGLARLGISGRLLGTGMALPWPVVEAVGPPGGSIVEDMQWGIDLAVAGRGPLFCPEAVVSSALPAGSAAFRSQRTRWEQGHLRTAFRQAPRLLVEAVRQGRPGLFGMACDLAIPPLALLAAWWLLGLTLAGGAWLLGAAWLPAGLLAGAGAIFAAALLAVWAAFCRRQIPWTALAGLPIYVCRKLPIYARLLVRRQDAWVRTDRPPAVAPAREADLEEARP